MPDIYGCFFKYAGKSSVLSKTTAKRGLVFANVETDRQALLYGTKTGVYTINKKENRRYIANDDISDSMLSFDIDIVTEDGSALTADERREIQPWLFGSKKYNKLYIDDISCSGEYPDGMYINTATESMWGSLSVMTYEEAEDYTWENIDNSRKRLYLNCRFLNPEVIESGEGIVGYKATLEADSNMLWEDPTSVSSSYGGTLTDTTSYTASIAACSNGGDYIYPEVTITAGSSGAKQIKISNYSDNSSRYTTFTDVPANAKIVMKGGVNYITPAYYSKWQGGNFVRLVDGDNDIHINGAVASVSFKFQNRRFL